MRKFLFGTGFVSLTGLAFLLAVGCGSDDDGGVQPVSCSIEVRGPTAGEIITTPAQTEFGDRVDINWTAAGGGDVRIELLKGGELLGVLHEEVPNSGYNWWFVDDLVTASGDDYQVRVSHLTSGDCGDTGPMFTIRDLRNCGIDVTVVYPYMRTNPAVAGDVMTIDWVSTSTTGSYDIELWQDTVVDKRVGFIAENVTGDNVVGGWLIDSFHVGSSWYYVVVQDREIDSCAGVSEVFAMEDDIVCEIEIHTPVTPGPYYKTSPLEITWDTSHTTGLLDIELYFYEDGHHRVGVIAAGVEASALAYMWTVDDFGYVGKDENHYEIKITDHDDPYCFSFSEAMTIPW